MKRNKQISFFCYEEEKEMILNEARRNARTISDWVRLAILKAIKGEENEQHNE